MCVAIIVAAGKGERMNHTIPKQFLLINGKALLEQSINTFSQISQIKQIIVVYNSDYYAETSNICNKYPHVKMVQGGQVRQQSVYNALQTLSNNTDKVLIHDAARPFVSLSLIQKVIDGLQKYRAVDVALPVVDTVKQRDNYQTLNRNKLYMTQTPQGFHYKDLIAAHEKEIGQNHTDDITLYLKHYNDIAIVDGEDANIKITKMADLMQNSKKVKTGIGFDVHKFDRDAKCTIKICGVDVKFERTLLAHSDGDVGIHALVDAIFGALAIGDIGDHFPPSDGKWKGADSSIFLDYAKQKCNEMQATINNVDVTIICEKPKISAYKLQMQKRIAELLDISISDVNIKATTTEKLGFLGRAEGIAAQASCTIII